MREALFVKQNTERWKQYENSATTDPDELAERFIAITDDLAFAKTFYPKSNTTKYLNGLAARFHQSIYKNKKEKGNRFLEFWAAELPAIFYKYRRQLLYSFIFTVVFTLIGVVSAKYDNTFVRLILGDGYVNMTNDNIAKGDPFGVYKQESPALMFMGIAANNIYYSFLVFCWGAFFSVGTVFQLLRNGLMLGSFEYYFFSKGLGLQSILVIWIHGTLEISSIVISGAAGLTLGNGLLFPKTYSRLQSFKQGAKDGIKMALGVVPIFIVAAFFEGFVTRHTGMPLWLSISILSASAAFITWYVVIYPARLSHKLTFKNTLDNEDDY
ncbi:hypothetical protein BEL04_18690 [Mucilaginibacter sp. PPCGB 2223]|uniref:stage II sporulation protein M n=1 Tax=Mucilaginibacter sp. PPCGB 2223 TaxID=1886027 RepID=UPI000826A772|nr:stage II sporulation protein M [Mucilaginibacter sp. PPCGB 2223]OCX50762.1 hypothetical protein BEL04_18690 [Mucilaginibacter sp. PPCGB 2223]